MAGLALAGPATTALPAVAAEDGFRIKPNELAPAADTRRSVQAFGAWTLICDEDVKAKRRVCNVSQVFVDPDGQPTFNWTLAATKGGTPVMILRAPNLGGGGRDVRVTFDSAKAGAGQDVRLSSCNEQICLGFLPVDAGIQKTIRSGTEAEIDIFHAGRFRTLHSPLKGLSNALAAIK